MESVAKYSKDVWAMTGVEAREVERRRRLVDCRLLLYVRGVRLIVRGDGAERPMPNLASRILRKDWPA
jgi:hypothetical protein